MKSIDLNVDIGEGQPFDAELLLLATSANICCGVHAGNWSLTQETIGLALDHGCRIGMHPGYPDRVHQGRLAATEANATNYSDSVRAQVEQFFNFVPAAYVKPHGAFYHDVAQGRLGMDSALFEIVGYFQIDVMGLPGTRFELSPTPLIREGFADRGYLPSGLLIPRGQAGAILDSERDIKRQTVRLAATCDSICLHGDTQGCVRYAHWVTEALLEAGFRVEAPPNES